MTRWLVAIACLLASASAPAHATIAVASNAELLAQAPTVAIIKVTSTAKGRLEGMVIEAFRGPKQGDQLKLELAALPGTGEALVVCADERRCAADRDRGGFFVIDLPGGKGPLMLEPGVIERRSLAALTSGKPPHELCMHAKVHFIDEPAADATIEGTFSAADGKGVLTGALLGKQPQPAALQVGDSSSLDRSQVRIELERSLTVRGTLLARGPDGCLVAAVLIDEPIARTPRRLTHSLTVGRDNVILARGTLDLTTAAAGIATGRTAITLTANRTVEPSGPMFSDNVLCDLDEPDQTGGLRLGCQARGHTDTLIWIDFGTARPPLAGAGLVARIATLFADGKPHSFEVRAQAAEDQPRVVIGTVKLTRVAD